MNDEEIIKALECCVYDDYAKCHYDCPYKTNCRHLSKDILDLIARKQTEIERLKTDNTLLRQDSNADSAEIRGLRRKLEISKSEAVKEFAERLKEKSFKTIRNYGLTKDVVEVCDIDNLVKEMLGEKE